VGKTIGKERTGSDLTHKKNVFLAEMVFQNWGIVPVSCGKGECLFGGLTGGLLLTASGKDLGNANSENAGARRTYHPREIYIQIVGCVDKAGGGKGLLWGQILSCQYPRLRARKGGEVTKNLSPQI